MRCAAVIGLYICSSFGYTFSVNGVVTEGWWEGGREREVVINRNFVKPERKRTYSVRSQCFHTRLMGQNITVIS
jgi:hypothetical protein